MKRFRRVLIISVICITVITALVIKARGFGFSNIKPNGEGYVYEYSMNIEGTVSIYVSVDESIHKNRLGLSYVKKREVASCDTHHINSNGETNTGAYFLDIGNPFITGPKNDRYRGSEYVSLDESMDTWSYDPHRVSSWATALVDPDDDNDAGPIRVEM